MSETSMVRVPLGDPIPLRFDPTTKKRLEDLAADIGPRRFGALVRVAARRLLADPDRVPEALAAARRASEDARRVTRVERPLDLDPATSTRLNQLAHDHRTNRSAIVRVAMLPDRGRPIPPPGSARRRPHRPDLPHPRIRQPLHPRAARPAHRPQREDPHRCNHPGRGTQAPRRPE